MHFGQYTFQYNTTMRYSQVLTGFKYSFISSYLFKIHEISRALRGYFEWRAKIDDSSRNFEANMANFAVSTESADGLALLGATISADEVQTRFWSLIRIHEGALRQFRLLWQFRLSLYMMTSSNGNIFRVTGLLCGEFPVQRPVTWSLDVFFDLHLNKRLSK